MQSFVYAMPYPCVAISLYIARLYIICSSGYVVCVCMCLHKMYPLTILAIYYSVYGQNFIPKLIYNDTNELLITKISSHISFYNFTNSQQAKAITNVLEFAIIVCEVFI